MLQYEVIRIQDTQPETNSIGNSLTHADSILASPETLHNLVNSKIHYHVNNSSLSAPILSQINFSKTLFITTLPPITWRYVVSFTLMYSKKTLRIFKQYPLQCYSVIANAYEIS